MGIANVTRCIVILGLVYDCVQNIDAYEFKIIHMVQKIYNVT
jgi:hypothetical protein